jgi:glycosyltransferase involved in cell wall biosynthesis
VGRIAPNKKQHELVEAFSLYRSLDPTARLILVGPAEIHDPYAAHVEATIRRLGLEPYVLITGSVAEAELAAYYRTCDLYWSMSEHEGFGVPLIESMWFDIPVLAKANSAIPETLGEAALMFRLTSVQREWQLWQVFS